MNNISCSFCVPCCRKDRRPIGRHTLAKRGSSSIKVVDHFADSDMGKPIQELVAETIIRKESMSKRSVCDGI